MLIHEQDSAGHSSARWAGRRGLGRDPRTVHRPPRRAVTDLPPIALVGDDGWTWVSRGDVDDADLVLQAPTFDLTRALVTRRSAAQLRSWTVRGDVANYLDAFAMLGPLPTTDLAES